MLDGIKRWFSGGASEAKQTGHSGLDAFASWSRGGQVQVRQARDGEGLVVDGKLDGMPWRLEWGPSQRPYVLGSELRIRGELPLPSDLQVIVLNTALQEAIEKTMFEQFVEGVQTRIDTETPAEMRWVVMYPKLSRAEVGELRDRYAAVSSIKPWVQQWLAGPLTTALLALKIEPTTALVLMIGRGRVTLRTEVEEASPGSVEPLLRLFEVALREARRVASEAAVPTKADTTPGDTLS
jgi:hypothetical protein